MGFLEELGRFIDDVLLLPEDLRETLETAEQALQDELFDEAAVLYREVLGSRPSLTRAWVGLSHAQARLGQVVDALEAAEHARSSDPRNGHVALHAAQLALAAGRPQVASEHADSAVRRLAKEGGRPLSEACVALGHAEQQQGRPDRAGRALRKAIASAPKWIEPRVALVECLAEQRKAHDAAVAAAALKPAHTTPAHALRIGTALATIVTPATTAIHNTNLHSSARAWLDRACSDDAPPADRARSLSLLSRLALTEGNPARAAEYAHAAVQLQPTAEILELLGDALSANGRWHEAASAFRNAAELDQSVRLWERAARTTPLSEENALRRCAQALRHLSPNTEPAASAQAWSQIAELRRNSSAEHNPEHNPEPSREKNDLTEVALPEASSEPRTRLARAQIFLLRGHLGQALEELEVYATLAAADSADATAEAATKADSAVCARLQREAWTAQWRQGEELDLPCVFETVQRVFSRAESLRVGTFPPNSESPQLHLRDAQRNLQRLRESLDRPLLLAIIGEFNAGKSTLINAFAGREVAPTGILPKTATINLLRDGAERRVRVVLADGSTREGAYGELEALIDRADSDAEAVIDHIEITLPSPLLERVWLLDTPGTNSLEPEHRERALDAVRRADAVLWVFDATQAGKSSEITLRNDIEKLGRPVIAVLNKVDRIAEREMSEVNEALQTFGSRAGPLQISARDAVRARVSDDTHALEQSGFPQFQQHLEQQVFSRSRTLKRAAIAFDLLNIVRDVLSLESRLEELRNVASERSVRAVAALDAAASKIATAVEDIEQELDQRQADAIRRAGREVHMLIKPVPGAPRPTIDLEDRRFMVRLLEHALTVTTEEAETRTRARVRAIFWTTALPEHRDVLKKLLPLSVRAAYATFLGYQRGRLAGFDVERAIRNAQKKADPYEAFARTFCAEMINARRELSSALRSDVDSLAAVLAAEIDQAEALRREQTNLLKRHFFIPLLALHSALNEITGRGVAGST